VRHEAGGHSADDDKEEAEASIDPSEKIQNEFSDDALLKTYLQDTLPN